MKCESIYTSISLIQYSQAEPSVACGKMCQSMYCTCLKTPPQKKKIKKTKQQKQNKTNKHTKKQTKKLKKKKKPTTHEHKHPGSLPVKNYQLLAGVEGGDAQGMHT